MRVPESWLRSFVSPDWTSDEIADRLTMAGLEVEEASPAAPPFSGVVVAEVRKVERHPNADKLSVCEVDAGDGTLRTIVCGAPNVAAGMRVPCAVPGAVLPGNFVIKPVRMRGVESAGMLCSARELGLSEDHSGLLALAPDAPIGAGIRDWLKLDDTVFTLKLTPNLAHCMSVFGVARELAALSGAELQTPEHPPVAPAIVDKLPVKISAADLCGRFSGRVIRGVNAGAPTPDWMRLRLERAGQRSISALVDISNYVMLELGRPSHVFDLDKIHGGLDVRWARKGETLELLNGQTVQLDADVGVIADEKAVESLAGIMGGEATAVSDDTRNIYVEAAFWWPAAVAGRSRRYNFATDAGARFERGVDPATTVEHIEYLTRLILDVCGGQAGPIDDQVTRLPERAPVSLRTARARKIIGVDMADSTLTDAFARLGLPARLQGDRIVVTPPSWRFDLQIEEDLIEEVARIWGYDRLPQRPPRAPAALMAWPEARRTVSRLKRTVAARDYQEVINYSFVESGLDAQLGLAPEGSSAIRLLNPIAAQMDRMRTTLWGSLVENLRANLNRKAGRVRLFEVGRVFFADPAVPAGPAQVHGIAQPRRLGLLAFGPAVDEHWSAAPRAADFFDMKGDLEALAGEGLTVEAAEHPALHPGRSARVLLEGRPVGWIGEMHPAHQQALELPQAPVLAEIELDPLLAAKVPVYREVSKFPPAIRDLAVVVPIDIPAARVLGEIASAIASVPAAALVKNVRIFDEYRGKGLENKEKSLAFRLWMQDTARTLSDADAADAVQGIVGWLADRIGARLRG
ncbi:phenylalanine--tRNA ligase subunit beta [Zeimonas arvi]|uniref:Phenylalanine--tRNA ligase beta subunit n=1 Tax=Zeimonas arvi TaxID=2498847 RepID=A0A5C8P095_9BURK|nr:phenylalanine--tRNA ligase subunit beta [Zeimonas arvi]TXL67021.1 phenylalanine--tRNA ligase subunit beta [Zeimonas arvi]